MNEALAALINSAAASAALIIVVELGFRLVPRSKVNAATRYAAWWLTLLLTMALPLFYLPRQAPKLNRVPEVAGGSAEIRVGPLETPLETRAAQTSMLQVPAPDVPFVRWLFYAWITATLVAGVRLMASCILLERIKARSTPAAGRLTMRLGEWLAICGSKRRDVRLLISKDIATPMLAGLWNPAVLIPERLLEKIDDLELGQIGLHEAAHLARRDDYALMFQRFVEALFVWHPAIRWIARRLEIEREIACDDTVVAATGLAKPYALCLTRVIELACGEPASFVATAAANERSHLAVRIAMLLDRSRHQESGLLRRRLAAFVAMLLAFTGVLANTPRLIMFAAPLVAAVEQARAFQQQPAPVAPAPSPVAAPAPSPSLTPAPSPTPSPQPEQATVRFSARVRDPMNRFVSGLEKEQFRVLEDGVEQEILDFSNADSAISAGFVVDTSGSMVFNVKGVEEGIHAFLSKVNPQDEYFLVKFSDRAELATGFTSNAEEIRLLLSQTRAVGKSALFDAVHLAEREMRNARNWSRALVILTDGDDNLGNYSEAEIRNLVRSMRGVDIYVVKLAEVRAPELLRDLAEQTGGRLFDLGGGAKIADITARIAVELHNTYTFSYRATNASNDGKYRSIKMELRTPPGLPALRVLHRPGYYTIKE